MNTDERDQTTRPSLLRRIQDGKDNDAWTEFVGIYRPAIRRSVMQYGLGSDDADDVAQTTLLKISQAIKDFEYDPKRGKFRNWVFTIAKHEAQRQFEKSQRPGRGVGGTDAHRSLEKISAREEDDFCQELRTSICKASMDRLRQNCTDTRRRMIDAVEMLVLEGLKSEQVAAALERPVDWVYRAKFNVLPELKRICDSMMAEFLD